MTDVEFAIAIDALHTVYEPLITVWLILFSVLDVLASIGVFFYLTFRRGFAIYP